MADMGNNVGV